MTLTDDAPPASRLPNPEQRTVIGHDHGPIRVMARAGKTHTLKERVCVLRHHYFVSLQPYTTIR